MKQVTFEKATRYAKKDVIIQSEILKEFCKNNCKNSMLKLIADEVPMHMEKIKAIIIDCFGYIGFIDIMSSSKFFVVEYDEEDYEDE